LICPCHFLDLLYVTATRADFNGPCPCHRTITGHKKIFLSILSAKKRLTNSDKKTIKNTNLPVAYQTFFVRFDRALQFSELF
jgi:hypothetical protein